MDESSFVSSISRADPEIAVSLLWFWSHCLFLKIFPRRYALHLFKDLTEISGCLKSKAVSYLINL